MKIILSFFTLAIMLTSISEAHARSYGSPGDVHVNGYTRGDGTYVSEHYRSAPDGNPNNNYGSGD